MWWATRYLSPSDQDRFHPLTLCSGGTRQCLFLAVPLLLPCDLFSSDNDQPPAVIPQEVFAQGHSVQSGCYQWRESAKATDATFNLTCLTLCCAEVQGLMKRLLIASVMREHRPDRQLATIFLTYIHLLIINELIVLSLNMSEYSGKKRVQVPRVWGDVFRLLVIQNSNIFNLLLYLTKKSGKLSYSRCWKQHSDGIVTWKNY